MTREPLKPGDYIEIRCTHSGLTFVGFVTRVTSQRVTARWERREGPEGLTRPAVLDPNQYQVTGRLITGPRVAALAKLLAEEEEARPSRAREPSVLAESSS